MNSKWTCLVLAGLVSALGTAPAWAEAPNTLSRDAAEDGWIQLFDGNTSFGWNARGAARWVVSDGCVVPVQGSGKGVLASNTEFSDFELSAEVWIDDVANSGIFVRSPMTGEINGKNAYEVNIFDAHPLWPTGSINDVARGVAGTRTAGRWNQVVVVADGGRLVVRVNGEETVNTRNSSHRRGAIGLQYNGEGEVRFRSLRLRPLRLKSIFNGKDLSGWKEVAGRKSIFSVTKEGWLNVKDGNGDLHSEKEYADFAFQLDIISNGTHLNSGVFFRAQKGVFWSGYESQIRNQWEGSDRTRPVDFGTGGIYNQQRARRVVSSDKEWFKMTIIATGRHLSTWVNGIQVSDWTDPRPANDNARQGFRAKAGTLTLQGHDPTTDLSFRHLRIAEYPAAK